MWIWFSRLWRFIQILAKVCISYKFCWLLIYFNVGVFKINKAKKKFTNNTLLDEQEIFGPYNSPVNHFQAINKFTQTFDYKLYQYRHIWQYSFPRFTPNYIFILVLFEYLKGTKLLYYIRQPDLLLSLYISLNFRIINKRPWGSKTLYWLLLRRVIFGYKLPIIE